MDLVENRMATVINSKNPPGSIEDLMVFTCFGIGKVRSLDNLKGGGADLQV